MVGRQEIVRGLGSYRLRAFLVILAVVLLLLAAVSIVFYQSNRSFLRSYITELNAGHIESIARLLDSLFYKASYSSAAIAERATVRRYVGPGGLSKSQLGELELAVQDLVSLFAVANSEISSIYVYSAPRKRVVTNRLAADVEQFHDRTWRDELPDLLSTMPRLSFRTEPVFGTPIISIIRRMDERERLIGAVAVNLDIESLQRLLGERSDSGGEGLYVVQEQKRVIFSTEDAALGTSWSKESDPIAGIDPVFVARTEGELFNLDYYSVSGRALFQQRTRALRRFLVLFLAGVFAAGLGVSMVLAAYAYQPIREIMDTLEHPDRYSAESESDDEIHFIENSVIRLMASNRRLEERLAERFRSLRRAHYTALQLQINRHFLYNTLDSIYWDSIEAFDPQDPVPQSVYSLSRFLRMVLSTDSLSIPLSEEIEITKQYANLLRIRFEKLVQLVWEIPSDMSTVRVPKLLLQPLVENAFYHGIKPTRRPGTVRIEGVSSEQLVELRVSDDGRGIPEEKLAGIRASLEREFDPASDHIGLLNIAQRLSMLFGEDAHLEVESEEHRGTTVAVRLRSKVSSDKLVTIAPRM